MMKLGPATSLTVAEARDMAIQCQKLVNSGLDPTDERNHRKNVLTLADFAKDEYMPYAKQAKRSWKDDESRLRREIGQMLGNIPITEVTTRDVMQLHAAIYKKNSAATANRYLALVSRLFSLAIQFGYVERNPVKGVKKYKEAGPRFRFLSGEELQRFLAALDAEPDKRTSVALK